MNNLGLTATLLPMFLSHFPAVVLLLWLSKCSLWVVYRILLSGSRLSRNLHALLPLQKLLVFSSARQLSVVLQLQEMHSNHADAAG